MRTLPYGRQVIDADDIAAVVAALKADMLTTGPIVETFEDRLRDATGAPFAVSCNNGTSALYLAARALDIGPGDVVVVPSITFLATASAPHLVGAEVVFSDVDPDTGLMRPEDLEDALSEAARRFPDGKVRAVFAVHLNGQTADLPALGEIADRVGAALVDDACHALGGAVRRTDEPDSGGEERRVGDGRSSAMSTFSFHPVKAIAMGEGGAVTTSDPGFARRLRLLRNHGMVRDPSEWQGDPYETSADGRPFPWYYEMPEPSLNFRVPDILCALGISQLSKLTGWVKTRCDLHDRYRRRLKEVGLGSIIPAMVPWGRPAWHLFAARIDFKAIGQSRAIVVGRLAEEFGIRTQVHYIPVHNQPYWRNRYGARSLPGAERFYGRTLSLPLYVGLSEADIDRVVGALSAILPKEIQRND